MTLCSPQGVISGLTRKRNTRKTSKQTPNMITYFSPLCSVRVTEIKNFKWVTTLTWSFTEVNHCCTGKIIDPRVHAQKLKDTKETVSEISGWSGNLVWMPRISSKTLFCDFRNHISDSWPTILSFSDATQERTWHIELNQHCQPKKLCSFNVIKRIRSGIWVGPFSLPPKHFTKPHYFDKDKSSRSANDDFGLFHTPRNDIIKNLFGAGSRLFFSKRVRVSTFLAKSDVTVSLCALSCTRRLSADCSWPWSVCKHTRSRRHDTKRGPYS